MVSCAGSHSRNCKQKEIGLIKSTNNTAEYYNLQSEYYHEKYYGNISSDETVLKHEIDLLRNTFRGLDVLEYACGTGFWTEYVAESASSVCAADVNSSMINVARCRLAHLSNVTFCVSDAFSISRAHHRYNGAFSVLFWCHIPLQRINGFLSALCASLKPGSPVLFIDQTKDSDAKNHTTDRYGNRIAKRELNGISFSVVKNIPSADQLHNYLEGFAETGSVRFNLRPGDSGMWSVLWNTAGSGTP